MADGQETMLFPGTVKDVTCGHNLLEKNNSIFYTVNISYIILIKHEPFNQQQLYTAR